MDKEMESENKRHKSPSQLNMMMRCSAQYMFRYEEGLKKAPGIALVYGSGVDEGLNVNFNEKIKTQKDLPADTVIDAFLTYFDREKDNAMIFKEDDIIGLRETGIHAIEEYIETKAPTLMPAEGGVQEKITIEYPDFDYDYMTVIDLRTQFDEVIDHKTAGKSPSKDGDFYRPSSFEHFFQMLSYHESFRFKHQRNPKSVELIYLIKKKKPESIRVTCNITKDDKRLFQNVMGRVVNAIEKKAFYPNRNNMMCSHRYCGYWAECESNFGGKVKE